jgi:hypothetical protein
MPDSHRRCFREPIPEIYEAATLLDKAVAAHLSASTADAEELIRLANIPAVGDWSDSIWGRTNPEIHRFQRLPTSPPYLLADARPKPRMPSTEVKRQIITRDGFHCRFCGIPVIPSAIRQQMRKAYPDAILWERNNAGQHAAFQCMWLQYDHLLPNQRGGDSSLENMVITCGPCNFGRMMWTVEEAGLLNPLDRPIQSTWEKADGWCGLTNFRI